MPSVEALDELSPPSGIRLERPRDPQDYVRIHEELDRLVDRVSPIHDSGRAVSLFQELGIEEPVEYETPWDLFRSLVSLTSLGETSFRAFIAAAEELGTEPTILVLWISHPMFPKLLVAMKLAPGGYLGYYAEEDLKGAFGL